MVFFLHYCGHSVRRLQIFFITTVMIFDCHIKNNFLMTTIPNVRYVHKTKHYLTSRFTCNSPPSHAQSSPLQRVIKESYNTSKVVCKDVHQWSHILKIIITCQKVWHVIFIETPILSNLRRIKKFNHMISQDVLSPYGLLM